MNERLRLFATALLQVCCVSAGTVFTARGIIPGMLITGFLISFIWTLNVKKAAFGDTRDRIIYATGAMCGTLAGYYLSTFLITIL